MIVEVEIKDLTGETTSMTDDFTEEGYEKILEIARSLQNDPFLLWAKAVRESRLMETEEK